MKDDYKNLSKEEMQKVRETSQILNKSRRVEISMSEAKNSHEAMKAFLLTRREYSRVISRRLKEQDILMDELMKLLPYVTDEQQFLRALTKTLNKETVRTIRMKLWEVSVSEGDGFIAQEGMDIITKDFSKEITSYIKKVRERWQEK